jgi:hypothetical protein
MNYNGIRKIISPEYNFLDNYKNLDFLVGPSNIISFNINNKLIILFGDKHIEPKKICNNTKPSEKWIHNFLINLFKNSPICIDFFLETISFFNIHSNINYEKLKNNYNKQKEEFYKYFKPINRGMIKTMETFFECLSPYKDKCVIKYKNTRFHNIEFRRFAFQDKYNIIALDNTSLIFFPLYYMLISPKKLMKFPFNEDILYDIIENGLGESDILFDYNNSNNMIYKYIEKLDTFNLILINIINGDMEKLSTNLLYLVEDFKDKFYDYDKIKEYYTTENLTNNSPYLKIKKQFKYLDEDTVSIYKNFMLKELNKILNKTKIEFKKLTSNLNKLNKIKFFNCFEDFFIDFGSLIVDSYTIARMLKSIYIYSDSSLIVCYAGMKHTNRYYKFFNKHYLKNDLKNNINNINKIKIIGEHNYGCVPINNYKTKWNKLLNNIMEQFKTPSQCSYKQL